MMSLDKILVCAFHCIALQWLRATNTKGSAIENVPQTFNRITTVSIKTDDEYISDLNARSNERVTARETESKWNIIPIDLTENALKVAIRTIARNSSDTEYNIQCFKDGSLRFGLQLKQSQWIDLLPINDTSENDQYLLRCHKTFGLESGYFYHVTNSDTLFHNPKSMQTVEPTIFTIKKIIPVIEESESSNDEMVIIKKKKPHSDVNKFASQFDDIAREERVIPISENSWKTVAIVVLVILALVLIIFGAVLVLGILKLSDQLKKSETEEKIVETITQHEIVPPPGASSIAAKIPSKLFRNRADFAPNKDGETDIEMNTKIGRESSRSASVDSDGLFGPYKTLPTSMVGETVKVSETPQL